MHLVLLPPHESGLFQGGSHCKDGAQEPFVPLVLALCVASGASGTGPSGRWERRVPHASG